MRVSNTSVHDARILVCIEMGLGSVTHIDANGPNKAILL